MIQAARNQLFILTDSWALWAAIFAAVLVLTLVKVKRRVRSDKSKKYGYGVWLPMLILSAIAAAYTAALPNQGYLARQLALAIFATLLALVSTISLLFWALRMRWLVQAALMAFIGLSATLAALNALVNLEQLVTGPGSDGVIPEWLKGFLGWCDTTFGHFGNAVAVGDQWVLVGTAAVLVLAFFVVIIRGIGRKFKSGH